MLRLLDAPAGTYKAVSVGSIHSCAVATDDTIDCWGIIHGPIDSPSGAYRAVSAGGTRSSYATNHPSAETANWVSQRKDAIEKARS